MAVHIGLSGAGKSTLARCINLLMQRTCLKNVCFPMELDGAGAVVPVF